MATKPKTPMTARTTEGADPVPTGVRRAFDLLYAAARRAALTADEHEAVRQAVVQVNDALVMALAPKESVPAEPKA